MKALFLTNETNGVGIVAPLSIMEVIEQLRVGRGSSYNSDVTIVNSSNLYIRIIDVPNDTFEVAKVESSNNEDIA